VYTAGFEGFLFRKEREGQLHAIGWFLGRERVTFSFLLHLYLLLNERRYLGVGCFRFLFPY